ncbi:MAG: hypothetical protein LH475_07395 [Cryobacterium sp.]|uniref:hypothetical protein n=1 Tax=unclassified Cryobacterium TaxID=2649013 RepID=UPI0018CB82B4|nr:MULTISPECIES: hypothetical protein [unclassified Cryobacterium]MCY7404434.1 hypothetical protein [Cryobacterium sp.]MEC5153940.1 hypothetical protein [Cryobacterium sp. CAN_C3]
MSDNLARVSFAVEREQFETPAPAHRGFRLVSSTPSPRARPRIFYAFTAVAGMAAIIVAQLLLSVGISQGAYEISSLQSSQSELGRTAASLSEDLVRVSSPQSLAANAEGLGMVSNSDPVYLRLSDGAVLGAPASASGSQAGAASLVPNALLTGSPLLSQLPDDAAATAGTVAITSAPVVPAGLAAPTTR